MGRGAVYALLAYFLWGILPIYWKQLAHVSSIETAAHRVIWSLVLLAAIMTYWRRWLFVRSVLWTRAVFGPVLLAAILLVCNWLVYIWAIGANRIVETSLGYFINPLVNVLLGVVFLRERLRHGQWLSIAIAAAGVAYLTVSYGRLPWIALTLAGTFGLYALVKKKAPLSSLDGLTLEMAVLSVPMLVWIVRLEAVGVGHFILGTPSTMLLLAMTGVATTVPLLLFGSAARRVPLSVLGLIQYLAPTIQFLVGVLIYREPFSAAQLAGFILIWTALVIFVVEGYFNHRHAVILPRHDRVRT